MTPRILPRSVRSRNGNLAVLARRMLLPATGETEVAAPRGEVPQILLACGLFTGQVWLRFAHLTVGEYLAATTDIDLAAERARLAARERGDSEVLPIAHARWGLVALEQALSEAEASDTGDHVRLGLVLRAVSYGGEGWRGSRGSTRRGCCGRSHEEPGSRRPPVIACRHRRDVTYWACWDFDGMSGPWTVRPPLRRRAREELLRMGLLEQRVGLPPQLPGEHDLFLCFRATAGRSPPACAEGPVLQPSTIARR